MVHELAELLPGGVFLQRLPVAAARGRRPPDVEVHRRAHRDGLVNPDLSRGPAIADGSDEALSRRHWHDRLTARHPHRPDPHRWRRQVDADGQHLREARARPGDVRRTAAAARRQLRRARGTSRSCCPDAVTHRSLQINCWKWWICLISRTVAHWLLGRSALW